jgi:small subunit ribosomal protein S1
MEASNQTFTELLEEKSFLNVPKVGEIVKGNIVAITKNEVKIDIPGFRTGVVRGPELKDESGMYETLKVGDPVEATVVGAENENGDLELSFRFAGHLRAWETVREMMQKREKLTVRILEANKGGMLVRVNHIQGFLPVSQLSPDHYPRVSGGEKNKILEKLRTYVGQDFLVQVIDVNEQERKLIVSEKSIWEDEQKEVLAKFKVGDIVEGEVVALAEFGAFIRFDGLEGLAHISELAWQRIDHPRDVLALGQKVKAQIINVEGSKIFLSLKRLIDDPWKNVTDKYHIGQIVKGKIIKANPFGFFVELDNDIHGLAHISELSSKPLKEPTEAAKIGDELIWKIVSIEPEQHRLGLSLKAMEAAGEEVKKEEGGKKAVTSESQNAVDQPQSDTSDEKS